MDLWDKVKSSLNKTLDEVESRSGEIKETIHFQLELHKLKNQLEEFREEERKIFLEIGQDYFASISEGLSSERIVEILSTKISFVKDLHLRMKDLQREINLAYQKEEAKEDSKDSKIDVTHKDEDQE